MQSKKYIVSLFMLVLSPFLFAFTGEVEYLEGDVLIIRNGEEEFADFGSPLEEEDVVSTESDSLAILRLSDGTALKIRENTTIRLVSLTESAEIYLDKGSFFSNVTKRLTGRYTVKTPSVVAGVRGTEFFIAYGRKIDEEADVWLCVNTGSVEVAVPETDEQVVVEAGEGINIVGGMNITKPKRYKWTEDLNWNTEPESGSVLDTTNLDEVYSDLLDLDYD